MNIILLSGGSGKRPLDVRERNAPDSDCPHLGNSGEDQEEGLQPGIQLLYGGDLVRYGQGRSSRHPVG